MKEVYKYIILIIIVTFVFLVGFDLFNWITVIIGAIAFASMEALAFSNLEDKAKKHMMISIILAPLNFFIIYRCYLDKDYNITVECLALQLILVISLGIFMITSFVSDKSANREEKKGLLSRIISIVLAIITFIQIVTPMISKTMLYKKIDLDKVSVVSIRIKLPNDNTVSYKGNDKILKEEIKNEISKLTNIKRCSFAEEFIIKKRKALGGKKTYSMLISYGKDNTLNMADVYFLNDGHVYMVANNKSYIEKKIIGYDEYYIITLSADIKNKLDEILKENLNE